MWAERPHEPLSLLLPSNNATVATRDEMAVPKFSVGTARYWSRWLADNTTAYWLAPLLSHRDLVCAMGPQILERARTYVQNYDFGPITGPRRPELSELRLEVCVPEAERRVELGTGPTFESLDFQFHEEHCLKIGQVGPSEFTDHQVHSLFSNIPMSFRLILLL